MRFAVHWPGQRQASPRSHGMPCRDVSCRVHVSVADISAGGTQEVSLADLSRRLLGPVFAAVSVPGLHPCQLRPDPLAPVAATPSATQPALQPGHRPDRRGLVHAAVRQRQRRRHAPVNAHHFAGSRPRYGLWDGRERDVPPAARITSDAVGLHAGRNRPRPAEPHPARLGHSDLRGPAAGHAVPGLLLHSQVPHEPGRRAMLPQHSLLRCRGPQPVPGHARSLLRPTDKGRERRFLPGPKAGVSTPRYR